MKNVISFALNASIVASMAFAAVSSAMAAQAQQDKECLALNVYFEARDQNLVGQIAVAHVTMNRVKDAYFPDTICDVVWQDNQFSWTHDGKSDVPRNAEAWEMAQAIASLVYYEKYPDITNGAEFYHADYISKPQWAAYMEPSRRIGNHIFYVWDGSWN